MEGYTKKEYEVSSQIFKNTFLVRVQRLTLPICRKGVSSESATYSVLKVNLRSQNSAEFKHVLMIMFFPKNENNLLVFTMPETQVIVVTWLTTLQPELFQGREEAEKK